MTKERNGTKALPHRVGNAFVQHPVGPKKGNRLKQKSTFSPAIHIKNEKKASGARAPDAFRQ